MSSLNVSKLSVVFGRESDNANQVLCGLNLEVESGEIVCVLGASGSGKSTLLRAIAGLEELADGSVSIDGEDLQGVPTHRRQLGLMFQEHALFPHLSVAANVAYGLAGPDSRGSDSRAARVDELLDVVGLTGFGPRSVDTLSGGEAQRVALARAIAPEPRLLMLDEPLGSLDRALRDSLSRELRQIITSLGLTALHVTHDQDEAFRIGDRVALVNDGVVEAIDSPEALWRQPPTEFVARFLGHPNLVRWPDLNDGSLTLVPSIAISLVSDTPSELNHRVTVESSEFTGGRWHHRTAAPRQLEFSTIDPSAGGAEVVVALDREHLWLVPSSL